jgi:hypothetical protein
MTWKEWIGRTWLAFACIVASIISVYSWGKYATIHWRGPQHDRVEMLFGDNMCDYADASQWISLLAIILAIAQITYSIHGNKSANTTSGEKKTLLIINWITLLASLFTFMNSLALT